MKGTEKFWLQLPLSNIFNQNLIEFHRFAFWLL